MEFQNKKIDLSNIYVETVGSLVEGIEEIESSGISSIYVEGKDSSGNIETVQYGLNTIVYEGNMVLNGTNTFEGSTLANNVYEFGNASTDVATANTYAQNMVVLKVNGNLTIDKNITLTACRSANGFGGPKGMFIYCTGTLTNNGTINMTARGAKAVGQNVYMWKNEDGSYEYVAKQNTNYSGKNRSPGSGGAPTTDSFRAGYATSYSGGPGAGTCYFSRPTSNGADDGGAGGGRTTPAEQGEPGGSGGAGNPGGSGTTDGGSGSNGTGGLLIIYTNTFDNNGNMVSTGSSGGSGYWTAGGGSGGGSINVFAKLVTKVGNMNVSGGAAGTSYMSGSAKNRRRRFNISRKYLFWNICKHI